MNDSRGNNKTIIESTLFMFYIQELIMYLSECSVVKKSKIRIALIELYLNNYTNTLMAAFLKIRIM